jgi:hypothetical protein
MEEMNKYQLIQGMINDLGNEQEGLQVRGYRNIVIVKSVIEALITLKGGLERDDEFVKSALMEKDQIIERLKAEIAELKDGKAEPEEQDAGEEGDA